MITAVLILAINISQKEHQGLGKIGHAEPETKTTEVLSSCGLLPPSHHRRLSFGTPAKSRDNTPDETTPHQHFLAKLLHLPRETSTPPTATPQNSPNKPGSWEKSFKSMEEIWQDQAGSCSCLNSLRKSRLSLFAKNAFRKMKVFFQQDKLFTLQFRAFGKSLVSNKIHKMSCRRF